MQFEILKIPSPTYSKSISRNQHAKYCKLITKKLLQRWEINDNFTVEQLLSVMLVIWKLYVNNRHLPPLQIFSQTAVRGRYCRCVCRLGTNTHHSALWQVWGPLWVIVTSALADKHFEVAKCACEPKAWEEMPQAVVTALQYISIRIGWWLPVLPG